jgi:hypothetical protein
VSRLTAAAPPGGRGRTSNPGWPRGPPPVGASRRDLPTGCARRSPDRSPGDGGSIPPTSTFSALFERGGEKNGAKTPGEPCPPDLALLGCLQRTSSQPARRDRSGSRASQEPRRSAGVSRSLSTKLHFGFHRREVAVVGSAAAQLHRYRCGPGHESSVVRDDSCGPRSGW